MKTLFTAGVLFLALAATGADFRAGVAATRITPPDGFWMSGYASRNRPSEAVLQPLWAKALVLQEAQGRRVVVVTTDLIGIPRELTEAVLAKTGLQRPELVLSCSHTHSGPAVGANLRVLFEFTPAEERRVLDYTASVAAAIARIIGEAQRVAGPAQLSFGEGSAEFAINRRQPTGQGFRIGVNTNGPVDPSVPVVAVRSRQGALMAVLFGYACHNTTLGGDFYQIHGDYAGEAQATLEMALPGTTALFMSLCGGDQNPNPRGTIELARTHGRALAGEVQRVLGTEMQRVRGPLRSAAASVNLEFAPHTREQFVAEAEGSDRFRRERAKLMLARYDVGAPLREVAYPMQAVRFGRDLTLLTLGGEVVVDYALRAKREFPGHRLIVAGYCNDVMCYIPSARVLREGGYEAMDSMIYYGMPGPFSERVEEGIFQGIRALLVDR